MAFAAAALAGETAAPVSPAVKSGSPPLAYVALLKNGFSIRHVQREVSAASGTTRLYISGDNRNYVDVPTAEIVELQQEEAAPSPIAPPPAPSLAELVSRAGDRHQLDSDFIHSVVRAESGYNPHAVSAKGAQGLMQLMPSTAARLGVKDSFDAAANLEGGTRYMRELLERYHYDVAKALAAYNAGPDRVAQYHGVPPYRETRAYVRRIIREYNRKKLAARKAAAASATSGSARN